MRSHPSPATPLLAIETSQHHGSVALALPDGTVREEPLNEPSRHDDDLAPAIDRLFRAAGLQPHALMNGYVAVSVGPGGFTGLRIAIATARMLAESLNVRLVAVPSALVAAHSFARARNERVMLIALASKRETAWITVLRRQSDSTSSEQHWLIEGEPRIADHASLALDGIDVLLADEHLPSLMREAAVRAGVPIEPPAFSAAACAAVGRRMIARGEFTDPLNLLPIYPREPEAVTLWKTRPSQQP